MVRTAGRKILSLEFAEAALGETNRLRRAGELEADLRKLFGVLSLPGSASSALEIIAVRLGGERSDRRTFPGGIHADYQGQQPDHERQILCVASWRFPGFPSHFLLFHFSQHAAQPAPRLRDGASASSAVAGEDFNILRLAFSPGSVRA